MSADSLVMAARSSAAVLHARTALIKSRRERDISPRARRGGSGRAPPAAGGERPAEALEGAAGARRRSGRARARVGDNDGRASTASRCCTRGSRVLAQRAAVVVVSGARARWRFGVADDLKLCFVSLPQ